MDQKVRTEGITITQVQELIVTEVVCQVVSDATFWSEDLDEGAVCDTQAEQL